MVKIYFKKTSEDAILPASSDPEAAAFDLYSNENVTLFNGDIRTVDTGLILANVESDTDYDFFLQIEGRSGLAIKRLVPLGGIIDLNYRGPIKVILHNLYCYPEGAVTHNIKKGDRIAQLIIKRTVPPMKATFCETDNISPSTRGSNGFGSTGK